MAIIEQAQSTKGRYTGKIDKEKTLKALYGELEVIEDMVAEGIDPMPQLASTGEDAAYGEEGRRWLHGAIYNIAARGKVDGFDPEPATIEQARYGESRGKEFAKSIKKKYGTVNQYGNIVNFYGLETVLSYMGDPAVGYSHLRAARAAGTRERALKFLEMVAGGGEDGGNLSVEALELLIYGEPDPASDEDQPSSLDSTKVFEGDYVPVMVSDPDSGLLTLNVGKEATGALLAYVGMGLKVSIKATAATNQTAWERLPND
jgi:hypothetical protein